MSFPYNYYNKLKVQNIFFFANTQMAMKARAISI